MAARRIFVANLYLIGTLVIAAGFVWMFVLAFVPQGFEMVLVAFAVTVSGISFWGLGYHLGDKDRNGKAPAVAKEYVKDPARQREAGQHAHHAPVPSHATGSSTPGT